MLTKLKAARIKAWEDGKFLFDVYKHNYFHKNLYKLHMNYKLSNLPINGLVEYVDYINVEISSGSVKLILIKDKKEKTSYTLLRSPVHLDKRHVGTKHPKNLNKFFDSEELWLLLSTYFRYMVKVMESELLTKTFFDTDNSQ